MSANYAAKARKHQATVDRLEKRLHEKLNHAQIRHEAQVAESRALLLMGDAITQKSARQRCAAPCGKLKYQSEHAAILANRHNGHTMRAYYSQGCGVWHAAKAESR
jgi:hypothetical protein